MRSNCCRQYCRSNKRHQKARAIYFYLVSSQPMPTARQTMHFWQPYWSREALVRHTTIFPWICFRRRQRQRRDRVNSTQCVRHVPYSTVWHGSGERGKKQHLVATVNRHHKRRAHEHVALLQRTQHQHKARKTDIYRLTMDSIRTHHRYEFKLLFHSHDVHSPENRNNYVLNFDFIC